MAQRAASVTSQTFVLSDALVANLQTEEVQAQVNARRECKDRILAIDALAITNNNRPSYIEGLPDFRYPIPSTNPLPTINMVTRSANMGTLSDDIRSYANYVHNPNLSRKQGIQPLSRNRPVMTRQSSRLRYWQKILAGASGNGKSYLMLETAARIIRQNDNTRVVFIRNCNEWVHYDGFQADGQPATNWWAKIGYFVQAMFIGFHADGGFNQVLENVDNRMTTSVSTFASNLIQELSKFCDARKVDVVRNGETVSLPLRPYFFFDCLEAVFGPERVHNRDIQIIIKELNSQGFFIVGAPQNNAFMEQLSGNNPLLVPIIIPRTFSQEEAYEYLRHQHGMEDTEDSDMRKIQTLKRHTEFFPAEIDTYVNEVISQGGGQADDWIHPGSNDMASITQPNASNPVFDFSSRAYRRAMFHSYYAVYNTEAPRVVGSTIPFANHPHVQPTDSSTGYAFSSPRRGYFSFHEVFPRGQDPLDSANELFHMSADENNCLAFAGVLDKLRTSHELVGPPRPGNTQNAHDPNFRNVVAERLMSKAPEAHTEIAEGKEHWGGMGGALAFYDTSLRTTGLNAMCGVDFVLQNLSGVSDTGGYVITAMAGSGIEFQDIINHCTGTTINWKGLQEGDLTKERFSTKDRVAFGIAEAAQAHNSIGNSGNECNVYLVTSHAAASSQSTSREQLRVKIPLREIEGQEVTVKITVLDIRTLDQGRTRLDWRKPSVKIVPAATS